MIDVKQLKRGLAEHLDLRSDVRIWRSKAHASFDPIWQRTAISRNAAYAWLAGELGIPLRDCHISKMNARRCRKVIKICEELKR